MERPAPLPKRRIGEAFDRRVKIAKTAPAKLYSPF